MTNPKRLPGKVKPEKPDFDPKTKNFNPDLLSKESCDLAHVGDGRAPGREIPVIDQNFPLEVNWMSVLFFGSIHVGALIGIYLAITGQVMWQTWIYFAFLHVFGGLGITAGTHRYWSHKSFKAKLPLRILLAAMQTFAFQYSIFDWSRNHRVHHKYSDTNADPHNAKRGFFFAHIGWLLCKRHPAYLEKVKGIDVSDLEADSVVMFQDKYYWPIVAVCIPLIPTVSIYFWGESVIVSFCFATFLRFCVLLTYTGLVNSVAHLWGSRPYDKNICPSDNELMMLLTSGEGSHNYHHTFPWDYRSDEFGQYRNNWITFFLDGMALIGLAYDLKTVSKELVLARLSRTGDGSHHSHNGGNVKPCKDLHVDEALSWAISNADVKFNSRNAVFRLLNKIVPGTI